MRCTADAVRHLCLLPTYVNVDIQKRYARISGKSAQALMHQVILANEGKNKDADFWRRAQERFSNLLVLREEQLEYMLADKKHSNVCVTNTDFSAQQVHHTITCEDICKIYTILCRQGRQDPSLHERVIQETLGNFSSYDPENLIQLAGCFAQYHKDSPATSTWFESLGDHFTVRSAGRSRLEMSTKCSCLVALVAAFRDADTAHQVGRLM